MPAGLAVVDEPVVLTVADFTADSTVGLEKCAALAAEGEDATTYKPTAADLGKHLVTSQQGMQVCCTCYAVY